MNANMMAGPQLSGSVDTGYGVHVSGFFAPTIDYAKRLGEELAKNPLGSSSLLAVAEMAGGTACLVCRQNESRAAVDIQVATLRREPHRFYLDLESFIKRTKAQHIDQLILTEGLGSLSLTILYRPMPGVES